MMPLRRLTPHVHEIQIIVIRNICKIIFYIYFQKDTLQKYTTGWLLLL
jgi:hypothetical protein